MSSPQGESALVLAYPELEASVGDIRRGLDPSARSGMPPHITLMYPFIDPDQIDALIIQRVGSALHGAREFDVAFGQLGWFGDDVLWLRPSPVEPILDLMSRLNAFFPECPAYGGEFAEVVPHLTLGAGAAVDGLRGAETIARSRLPVEARSTTITLMVKHRDDGPWDAMATWALGRINKPTRPRHPLPDIDRDQFRADIDAVIDPSL